MDASSVFAQWLAVDLAVSRALANRHGSWLEDDGGEVNVLNSATSGFLGSTTSFGTDALSLVGTGLQNFTGLAEGVQHIA